MPQAQGIERHERAIRIGILDGQGQSAPASDGNTAYLGAAAPLSEQ